MVNPRLGWYISDGWKFRDAEPSDFALNFGRLGGAIMVITGIIVLFST